MSLINDALRRRNEENKGVTPDKSDGAPMQPVHPTSRDRASYFGPILTILIVLLLLLAAFLFWKGLQTKKELAVAAQSQIPPQPLPAAPVENKNVAPLVVATPVPPPTPVAAVTEPTNPVTTNLSQNTNPVVPLPPPGPTPLKLPGIFYRPSDPTVMINGKTLGIGEAVAGARILKIERQEVTVQRDGKVEVLRMD